MHEKRTHLLEDRPFKAWIIDHEWCWVSFGTWCLANLWAINDPLSICPLVSNILLQAVCACFSLAALMTDDYESFTEPQQDGALSHVVSSLRSEWRRVIPRDSRWSCNLYQGPIFVWTSWEAIKITKLVRNPGSQCLRTLNRDPTLSELTWSNPASTDES